jgi:5'(3')-deoxyribonucleotidase
MSLYVALDMDDVVTNLMGLVIDKVELETGTRLAEEDFTQWGWRPASTALGESWWEWLKRKSWLWSLAEPIPGALNGIDRLRAAGHFIELITTKPVWAEREVFAWLEKYKAPVNRVTFVPHSDDSGGHALITKASISPADVLVDDHPRNVEAWLETGRPAILFERPWSRGYQALNESALRQDPNAPYAAALQHARSWADILTIIDQLEEEKNA